jgi:predicted DNA-binding ArsR family transcriptional regulator
LHLKQGAAADIPARAIHILDKTTRRRVLGELSSKWERQEQLEDFVNRSPLIEVQLALEKIKR